MGKRGRNAITKPKPPAGPPGRPKVKIDAAAHEVLAPLVPMAAKVMEELMLSAKERKELGFSPPGPDDRTRLLAAAYVRLLDRHGEFTAEVATGDVGQFRFFAAPGEWTVRALAPRADAVERSVTAAQGAIAEVQIPV
jgi:hypothetical protein